MDKANHFPIKILLLCQEFYEKSAASYAVHSLTHELEMEDIELDYASDFQDANAIIHADLAIQALLIEVDNEDKENSKLLTLLGNVRKRNLDLPIFLISERESISELPTEILSKVNDFIWLMEDTPSFIAGRIIAATKRYREFILPPMFKALAKFAEVHEYSWHTPGHTGGTAFLRSPVGKAFFHFFKEPVFRSDLSISVGELGSLLDHSGVIGESERYMSRVFGSDRSYHVTNGSSTSNRVILMASVTRNQVTLCDRNCHKSVEHAMTMSGAIPTYLVPSRNYYGIIGPIFPENLTPEAVKESIKNNPYVKEDIDQIPRHAIITNSTYDGLCYNVKRVKELLEKSVNRLHFDEAWYGYAKFDPLYKDRFAMSIEKTKDCPTIFATQSTHKLLAAFSQASMIHIREGKENIEHARFNESFMMHATTSPLYQIIASNDISAAMMSGNGGAAIIGDSIREAIAFRKTVARINAEYKAKKDWFFNIWQPESVNYNNKKIPFYKADDEYLATHSDCWTLEPNAAWHGFGNIEKDYCMLDPIKVTVTTPGILDNGKVDSKGIPAPILSAYLDSKGIIVEKTTDFTILFLFSMGITKGKWGTLLNTLFEFKNDYNNNTLLEHILPDLVNSYPERYQHMGLKDLSDEMFKVKSDLNMTKALSEAFSILPEPKYSPVESYEILVRDEIEPVKLNDMAGRIVATGVVPYPPGIPLLMPGEVTGKNNGPVLTYLKALESFDSQFPGFTHDIHGVEVKDGKYEILCIKNNK